MVFKAATEILILIVLFNSGIYNFLNCKFGNCRRLVLILDLDTLFPTNGRFPDMAQNFDILFPYKLTKNKNGQYITKYINNLKA